MWSISFIYITLLSYFVCSVDFTDSGSFGRLRGSPSVWARGPPGHGNPMSGLRSRRDRGSFLRDGFLRVAADISTSEGARTIESIDQLTSAIDGVLKEHPTPSPLRDNLLQDILRDIKFSPSVMKKFVHWDSSKPYTRNRITFLEGQYELLVLCWNPGRGSKIHDHPGDGCYVRMLQGRLVESIYKITDVSTNTLEVIKSGEVSAGDVTYINDGMGVHRLANPDPSVGAISLHLYTPPTLKCTVWDESKGDGGAVIYTPNEATMRCTTNNGKLC